MGVLFSVGGWVDETAGSKTSWASFSED